MSEQKPMSMDAAPKDGTHILGYGVHLTFNGDYTGVTGWMEVECCQEFGWWANITGETSTSTLTAWLPLPPTPTEEA